MGRTIVGQAPGRTRGEREALEGPCGDRFARLAGLGGVGELRARARLVNLLGEWPGRAGKGDAFLAGEVLLLGRGVARAFRVDSPFLEWRRVGGAVVAVVPHPSGVSRWWNCPENRARASAFLRGALS